MLSLEELFLFDAADNMNVSADMELKNKTYHLFAQWLLLRINDAFYIRICKFALSWTGGNFNISGNILQKIREMSCKAVREDEKDISHKSEACV